MFGAGLTVWVILAKTSGYVPQAIQHSPPERRCVGFGVQFKRRYLARRTVEFRWVSTSIPLAEFEGSARGLLMVAELASAIRAIENDD